MRVQSAPCYESMFSDEPEYIIEEFRTDPDKLWHKLAKLRILDYEQVSEEEPSEYFKKDSLEKLTLKREDFHN